MIKELEYQDEILQAFPLIQQLRSHLSKEEYLELVSEAKLKEGYQMYALFDEREIVAVIGFQPMITLYYGRFIWVCDLVTDQNRRSKGYGKKLLNFVHDYAADNNYASVALSSGLQRVDAHRFYENRMGYDKASYVFKKPMK